MAHQEEELRADPFSLLQPFSHGEENTQYLVFKGYAIESALYFASATGAIIYTDLDAQWRQLHLHATQAQTPACSDTWAPVRQGVQSLRLPVKLEMDKIVEALDADWSGAVCRTLGAIVSAMASSGTELEAGDHVDRIVSCRVALEREDTGQLQGTFDISAPNGGFENKDSTRLLLTYGRVKEVRPVAAALFVRIAPTTRVSDGQKQPVASNRVAARQPLRMPPPL